MKLSVAYISTEVMLEESYLLYPLETSITDHQPFCYELVSFELPCAADRLLEKLVCLIKIYAGFLIFSKELAIKFTWSINHCLNIKSHM